MGLLKTKNQYICLQQKIQQVFNSANEKIKQTVRIILPTDEPVLLVEPKFHFLERLDQRVPINYQSAIVQGIIQHALYNQHKLVNKRVGDDFHIRGSRYEVVLALVNHEPTRYNNQLIKKGLTAITVYDFNLHDRD